MSYTKFWAACLASYNNGTLHGAWIEASDDVDAMQDAVNAMLLDSPYPNVTVDCGECETGRRGMGVVNGASFTGHYPCNTCGGDGKRPSAEEWVVHDWDDESGAFSHMGETSDLKAIAATAALLERAEDRFGDNGPEIVAAYWSHMGYQSMPGDAHDAVEQAADAYAGSFTSWEAWAEDYAESTGLLDGIPENLRYYFDFEAYGRDARLNGDLFEQDGHWFYAH